MPWHAGLCTGDAGRCAGDARELHGPFCDPCKSRAGVPLQLTPALQTKTAERDTQQRGETRGAAPASRGHAAHAGVREGPGSREGKDERVPGLGGPGEGVQPYQVGGWDPVMVGSGGGPLECWLCRVVAANRLVMVIPRLPSSLGGTPDYLAMLREAQEQTSHRVSLATESPVLTRRTSVSSPVHTRRTSCDEEVAALCSSHMQVRPYSFLLPWLRPPFPPAG